MNLRLEIQHGLTDKLKEALVSVMPVPVIVLLLSSTVAPIPTGIMLSFILGTLLLILGMMFFTHGSEMSMSYMGEKVGSSMTKTKNLPLIILITFVIGFMITVAEPDLLVLAEQVPSVPSRTIVLFVSVGVGLFLVLSILRMFFRIRLSLLLIVLYLMVFILSIFVPEDFLPLAFDSGGVTTGPMTVPFIMALGVGIASVRSDKHAENDSFGLVALCSVGPILAVMVLGIIYNMGETPYRGPALPDADNSVEMARLFILELPQYMMEIALALLPILFFFSIYQMFMLKLKKKSILRIGLGLVLTYIGLVLFLTGVHVGFLPAGYYLGSIIASGLLPYFLIPIAMLIGFFVVKAEPAVYVLNKQVEEITDGDISARTMGLALSIGVAISLGLSMLRMLTGISILWFLLPGYSIAILISFFVPKIYTAIAFDSGGVASGPMTATFLLPFAQGACVAVGGNIVRDSFGVVAMVAMTPLITIQVLGLISQLQKAKKPVPAAAPGWEEYDDFTIIEL